MGVSVERDPKTELLVLDHELTVSLVLSRCLRTGAGSSRWMLRFEEGLRPDLTIPCAWMKRIKRSKITTSSRLLI
jgi:hypothetical protein